MKRYAVIVASGKGTRMGAETPKQFLPIAGKPLLMYTLEAFAYNSSIELILVLPEGYLDLWQELMEKYQFQISHKTVVGGAERTDSVKAGLALIQESGVVAIHDGVRPLVTPRLIDSCYQQAEQLGNAIAAVPLKDSIRKVSGSANQAEDRSQFQLVQTPQCFQTESIIEAYDKIGDRLYTDDASVLEASGHAIHLIAGDYSNIKLTTPEDLLIAETLLKDKTN